MRRIDNLKEIKQERNKLKEKLDAALSLQEKKTF